MSPTEKIALAVGCLAFAAAASWCLLEIVDTLLKAAKAVEDLDDPDDTL